MNFDISSYINADNIEILIRVVILLVLGLGFTYGLAFIIRRSLTSRMTRQSSMVINRIIIYSGYIILILAVLNQLDFDIAAIFGAAGVVSIVIGIASQTSIGNIISGFFLVSEKSFEIGDTIRIGDKTGSVYSVDLLSVKIKTFDNLLIRIPNQTVISTEVVNLTRFPIRRMDIIVGVAYKEDLKKVMQVLKNVAIKNPLYLEEPEPLVLFQGFGSSSIDILLGVWFEKSNFRDVKNNLIIDIKEAFDKEGIEIPFPHISVYSGEVTKSFPVKIEDSKEAK